MLYSHRFRGTGSVLFVSNPTLREYFVRNGYAWAASSYSTNFYDVRQGVLDTHALSAVFRERTGRTPSSTFVADLVGWVENGERPEGDELLDSEAVASPQFGCAFTAVTRAPYPACAPDDSERH